ncbi:MAG: response regulator [Treponema sp.]|jgi:signal transduction histidine kinase/CheY-like chemotaxis protein|nr:response regulator [Treponema sp.]
MISKQDLLKKILPKAPLFAEVLFTLLAFLTMAVLSFVFMNTIVHGHLIRNTETVLSFQRSGVENRMFEYSTVLDISSWRICEMILNGANAKDVQNYLDGISTQYSSNEKYSMFFNGFAGYFETLPGGPVFLSGLNRNHPKTFDPSEHPWYKEAISAHWGIAETLVYEDIVTKEAILVYSRCIFDDEDRRLGVVCLRINVSALGREVIETSLAQGGYGMILSRDLVMIAHPSNDFVGKYIDDIHTLLYLKEDFIKGREVSESHMVSYREESSIAFFRKLSNGWYLGLVTPKGPYYQSVTSMTLILSALGVILAVVLIFILIRIDSARSKSDTESRHKSAFLANMSHEIRTPMNAIIGMTTIGKAASESSRKDYCFTKIQDASKHLLGVINDILDMSKIEAGKLELSSIEFNFRHIVQRAVDIMNFRIDEKRQNFYLQIDNDIPQTIIADDQRFTQVVTNLLGNAVKFTPEEGSISLDAISLGEENGLYRIQISVSDTGIGITKEQMDKLFNSFHQAETSTTRKFGGTGLGLSISKSIIDLMGGDITVSSEPGNGSTFSFTMLVKKGTKETQELYDAKLSSKMTKQDIALFEGKQIMLAEDMEINREIVLTMFEPLKLKIDCAENGMEAVRKFCSAPDKYEVIFMDVHMPELDGYEATRRIRSFEKGLGKQKWKPHNRVPVIAMTANVFKEDIEKCLESGMDDHLGKPLDFDVVIEKLRIHLS